jgi:hypothetical protein
MLQTGDFVGLPVVSQSWSKLVLKLRTPNGRTTSTVTQRVSRLQHLAEAFQEN